jgi:hypothetical protein
VEDNLHLFKCKHSSQRDIIAKMKYRIKQDNNKEPQLSIANTIVDGMFSGIVSFTWQAEIQTTHEKLTQKWIRQQNAIGWRHIAFGRLATALTEMISSILQEQGIESWLVSGEKWTRRLIQTIWDAFLQL